MIVVGILGTIVIVAAVIWLNVVLFRVIFGKRK